MSPSEVRATLGSDFKNFKRGAADVYPCDYYTGLGCFVYYADKDGLVDAVEFCSPATPNLDGLDLLGLSAPDLLKRMAAADPAIVVEADGFRSFRLGVGAWYPNIEDEPLSPAEAVIVFVRGYYD
jgi:hypothetical protein